jgi:hypothetical protein
VDTSKTPLLHAFADDNVANRASAILTLAPALGVYPARVYLPSARR